MQNAVVYSVTELNAKVRATLEQQIATVAVSGEISNLVKASSGHYYFTLKDSKAQIRCAYFLGLHRKPNIILNNGQQVIVLGKISLYEPRGDYQLIVSAIQDTGVGLLYQQFIELKTRLEQQGLFAPELKKPIPKYPEQIAIITSPVGAALHDIQTTLARRYPLAKVVIYPTEVQGTEAHKQIIEALKKANQESNNVILLSRGGGSIEDLWAFNNEQLAHAIRASQIPVITGIGHETDFTISDFVADFRAATPTAAAEKATPNQLELAQQLNHWQARLNHLISKKMSYYKNMICWYIRSFEAPEKIFLQHWQRTDLAIRHLNEATHQIFFKRLNHLQLLEKSLHAHNPLRQLTLHQQQLTYLQLRLDQALNASMLRQQQQVDKLLQTLTVIGPQATLDRGYAIATLNGVVLTNTNQVSLSQQLDITLSHGQLKTQVVEIAS